jgi:hypothetical protein
VGSGGVVAVYKLSSKDVLFPLQFLSSQMTCTVCFHFNVVPFVATFEAFKLAGDLFTRFDKATIVLHLSLHQQAQHHSSSISGH